MNIKQIKITLTKEKPLLAKKYYVKTIGVFGSYAREEQTSKSDIDILVRFSDKASYFDLVDLADYLEKNESKEQIKTCNAMTKKGVKCMNKIIDNSLYCGISSHQAQIVKNSQE